jgi:uroporphyrinogen-III synthase
MPTFKFIWVPKPIHPLQKQAFESMGFVPIVVQPITYEPVFNPDIIGKIINRPATWIFTSERSVRYLKPWLSGTQNKGMRQIYTVGERSAKALRDLGFQVQTVAPDANTLLKNMIHGHGPITYFCNADRSQLLPDFLRTHYDYEEVQVYKGEMNHQLPQKLPDAWLGLSPRTVLALLEAKPELRTLPVVSIGPTTTAALQVLGIQVAATCKTPTLEMCFIELSKLKQHGIEK